MVKESPAPADLTRFDDPELLKRGREALKLERFPQAREFLAEYCDRQVKKNLPVPTGTLAIYALALGHTRALKEGMELCLKAVSSDRRNPHIYWALAQLYMLSGSRKKAVEAIGLGLRVTPDHAALLQLRRDLGERKPPPIRFLSRDNAVNVKLGKALARLRTRPTGTSGRKRV